MKIGILTFHAAHNYGAVLQAYGLQEFLRSRGHKVEIIDYRPTYLTRPYGAFPRFPNLREIPLWRKILRLGNWGLHLPKSLALVPAKIVRRRKFEQFISQKLALSRERFSENDRLPAENYDAIIFGSDQIWSPIHTTGGDPIFLGDFAVPAGTLKIAYAASAGAASGTLGENAKFVAALKNFDAISVRERNLAESLQPHTPLAIETVLDPTLLAEREVWEKLAAVPAKMPKKFVLVYQVSYNPAADKIAQKIAREIGAEVVSLFAYSYKFGMRVWENPAEFVGWFKHAACVISTSFHGTAFSVIFEKPFYYVGNGNAGENRPKQLLTALNLLDRYVTSGTPISFSNIDYCAVSGRQGGGYSSTPNRFAKLAFGRALAQANLAATRAFSRRDFHHFQLAGTTRSREFFCCREKSQKHVPAKILTPRERESTPWERRHSCRRNENLPFTKFKIGDKSVAVPKTLSPPIIRANSSNS